MKANKGSILTFIFSALFFLASCADKDKDSKKGAKDTKNESINEWIYNEMSFQYFWNENLPNKSTLNYDLAPNKFFYKLLYRDKDRFSTLENDGKTQYDDDVADNKTNQDIGFEFQAFHNKRTNRITLCVTFVKNGSNAQQQGLKRGDWIEKVNGGYITIANFQKILDTGQPSYRLEFENRAAFTLNATSNFAENPIHFKETYEIGGKKIGYIIYNFFANDADDRTMNYALQMNSIMGEFKSKGIQYLILDLRYNGGGYVESGNYIASAIVPNRGATGATVYTKRAFNKKYDEYLRKSYSAKEYENRTTEFFHNYITKGRVNEEIPNLNIEKLYVITSRGTASASEQIINGLEPYLKNKIEIVGERTVGKNMESFAIKDEKNKDNKWVLHALTSVSFNSKANKPEDNNYSTGFHPTVAWEGVDKNGKLGFNSENDEFQTLREEGVLYPLGDRKETLLAKAIEHITGSKSRTKRSLAMPTPTTPRRNMTPIGSSLDRKQKHMIIENQEVK